MSILYLCSFHSYFYYTLQLSKCSLNPPRVKNKRELNASLKGATLGDPDADDDDTLKWIKKAKKREKELAKKRMAELENMDKHFQEEYTESKSSVYRQSNRFDIN